jgi:hypothetical protein
MLLFALGDQILDGITLHLVVGELVDVARREPCQAQSALGYELRVLPQFSRRR